MTTIVVDAIAGVMCSDSQWTDGAQKGPMRKVWRVGGALAGLAGDVLAIEAALRWLRSSRRSPAPAQATAIALMLEGRTATVWTRADGFVPVPTRYAIGTGGAAARGALAAGATAARALAIAKEIDATTSGGTRVYKLKAVHASG